MPTKQIRCPNCQQPVSADVRQIFDLDQDPQAKQILLSGAFNVVQCPHCGYQGEVPLPLVYHDSENELLLTFFPPALSVPHEEQERRLGELINRVVTKLPQEKRKGYLLQPQAMLTRRALIERVLEAEGITKEMLEEQEEKMSLLRRLIAASEQSRPEIIEQEDENIDESFFMILSRLFENMMMAGDKGIVQEMQSLQAMLLEHSSYGQEVQAEIEEFEKAREALEALGQELTRQKLVDLVLDAPNESRLQAYAQLVRQGMDYQFFQLMSDKIEAADEEERPDLIEKRNKLLEYIEQIDRALEERVKLGRQNLETLLEADDLEAAVEQNLAAIDEYFIQALTDELQKARKQDDLERSSKLQRVMSILNEKMERPPEYELLDDLVEKADDEKALRKTLESQADEVVQKIVEMVTGILGQLQAAMEAEGNGEERKEMQERLQKVYDVALQISMQRKMKS
jgi:predicted lactoylglutathione lyase